MALKERQLGGSRAEARGGSARRSRQISRSAIAPSHEMSTCRTASSGNGSGAARRRARHVSMRGEGEGEGETIVVKARQAMEGRQLLTGVFGGVEILEECLDATVLPDTVESSLGSGGMRA